MSATGSSVTFLACCHPRASGGTPHAQEASREHMARMPDQKIWFVRGLRAAGAAAAMPVDSGTRSYAFELDQKGSKRNDIPYTMTRP